MLKTKRILKPAWPNPSTFTSLTLTGGIFPLAKGAQVLFEGDSLTSRIDGCSIAGWLAVASGGRVNYPPVATPGTVGLGGTTPADALADVSTNLAAYPNLKLIIIHSGTNALNGSTAAQIIADKTAYINAYNAAGVHVIDSAILPRGDAVGIAQEAKRLEVNAAIAALTGKKLTVVNHDATMLQADTTLFNQSDKLHATVKGTRVMATNIFNVMSFVAASLLEEMPTNALSNPAFTGITGQVAGTFVGGSVAPDNWRIQNDTGATVTASIVNEGGVNKVQFDISGSATTASAGLYLRRVETAIPLLIGDWVEGKMNIEISGAGGVGDPVGLRGWNLEGGYSVIFDEAHNPALYGSMEQPISGPVRMMASKATADVPGGATIRWIGIFIIGAVAARIKISAPVAGKFGT